MDVDKIAIQFIKLHARFACLRCAAAGNFVPAGCALRVPGVTLAKYKEDSISKYVCLTVIMDIARKSPNLSIFTILIRNDEAITE